MGDLAIASVFAFVHLQSSHVLLTFKILTTRQTTHTRVLWFRCIFLDFKQLILNTYKKNENRKQIYTGKMVNRWL